MRRLVHRAIALAVSTIALLPAESLAAVSANLPQLSLAPLVDQITPAVVNIAAVHPSPQAQNPLLRDPYFRRFFRVPDAALQPRLSAGSGVIIDAAAGIVLTNHHVVENATQVEVTLKDRRRFTAEIVGSDPATDVAVLRIAARNLSALPLGDADRLKVGDYVVAVGNPFGIGQTVTAGIVSALDRNGFSAGGYDSFIQTDAPINPGNSGGALVNTKGELIGINTALLATTGGNIGIGFAIPSNTARAVMDQILKYGEVKRGTLGVTVQDLTAEVLAVLSEELPQEGIMITGVAPKSAAAAAGLRQGDIIFELGDRAVTTASGFRNAVGLLPIDSEVTLGILRQGRRMTVHMRTTACAAGCTPLLAARANAADSA